MIVLLSAGTLGVNVAHGIEPEMAYHGDAAYLFIVVHAIQQCSQSIDPQPHFLPLIVDVASLANPSAVEAQASPVRSPVHID